MLKHLITSFFIFLLSSSAISASDMGISLSQPKSPSRLNSFKINFVALTTEDKTLYVRCYKKFSSDSSFTQFGNTQTLLVGGNTGDCQIDSNIVSRPGNYEFKVTLSDNDHTIDSNVVSYEYETSGPSTPTSYSKEKIADCTYKISFTAASDNGQTVRVEVYRSDSTTFSADSSNRFANIHLGSGENGQASITVPNCSKNWYFAIRAFDISGNGSGIIGDQEIKIITSTTESSSVPASAKVVDQGSSTISNPDTNTGEQNSDQNETSNQTDIPSQSDQEVKGASTTDRKKQILQFLIVAVVAALSYVIFTKKDKK